jgi:hypothetical protein
MVVAQILLVASWLGSVAALAAADSDLARTLKAEPALSTEDVTQPALLQRAGRTSTLSMMLCPSA